MFNPFRKKMNTTTLELIDAANTRLFGIDDTTSDEYKETLDVIERLHKLHQRESEGSKISPDTIILVLGNLAGILLILNYEKLGIVTSKAIGFVIKAR